jgi:alpha/beta hydrolase fold-3 domain protein
MKKILLLGALSLFSMGLQAQRKFKITLDEARNGSYTVSPKLPKDGIVKRGTTLTISATANEGYIPDGGYYATIQDGYVQYHETMQSSFKVKVDKEMNIGYSFVPKETEENLRVIQDIVYAKPGVKALKYDIYAPKGKDRLPCIIIIHGGGWSSNSEEVMRGFARELANSGRYVVFNIDYRWMDKLDGDKKPTALHQIIEDVYGAVIHITENAAMYGGDSNNIFLTGDSAGGHLAASVANFVERLGDKGFNKIENTFQFVPTYIPKGKSIEEIKQKLAQSIKGVAPSYGVFSMQMLSQRFADYPFLKEVAPINYIPEGRAVPYFLLRGTEDQLIKNEEVESYAKALIKAGQRVEYLQVGGANHAFLDWKPDEETQETFSKYGKYCTKHMLLFFDNILGK